MEGIPNPKTAEILKINELIKTLAGRAPQEQAMKELASTLAGALKEVGKSRVNDAYVHLRLQSIYGIHSALAAKGIDVVAEMEEIVEKIKALAKPRQA